MSTRVFKENKDVKVRFLGATLLSAEEVVENCQNIPAYFSPLYKDIEYLRSGDPSLVSESDYDEDEDEDFDEDNQECVYVYNPLDGDDTCIERRRPNEPDEYTGYPITRPALIIDRDNSNVSVGDIICLSGYANSKFTVISEGYALLDGCLNAPTDYDPAFLVDSALFNEDYCFDDCMTDYGMAKIKKRVDEWYAVIKEMYPEVCN